LTVNGDAVLSNDSNTSISTTGNITANSFIGDGSQLTGLPAGTGNLEITGTVIEFAASATEELITISPDGLAGQAMLQIPRDTYANVYYAQLTNTLGNVRIISGDSASIYEWRFDNTGNLTLPTDGYLVVTTGIIGSGASPAPSLSGFSSIATTGSPGNISASGNLLISGYANITGTINGSNAQFSGNIAGNFFIGDGSQLTDVNAVTVDITDTNGLTTVYYPTFVENRTTGQIARADVDLTYKTDDNLLTVGNVSVTGNVTGNTAGFVIGYRDIPQVSFTADATLAATDAGKHYYSTLATANTLTIANNTSVGWSVGTAITIVNRGTGNMTIAQGTGVSLYLAGNSSAGNRTVTTYGMATLLNVAANVWMINGTGVS